MSQASGRIVCPQCGANNFDTVTACWKCSAALPSPAAAAAPPRQSPAPQRPQAGTASQVPQAPAPAVNPMEAMAYRGAAAAGVLGNPRASNRAAMWLGLLMPYFGLPIGLAFVMCDDRRRQEVGRICIWWSILSLAVHLLLSFVAMLGTREYLTTILNQILSQAKRSADGGGGMEMNWLGL